MLLYFKPLPPHLGIKLLIALSTASYAKGECRTNIFSAADDTCLSLQLSKEEKTSANTINVDQFYLYIFTIFTISENMRFAEQLNEKHKAHKATQKYRTILSPSSFHMRK